MAQEDSPKNGDISKAEYKLQYKALIEKLLTLQQIARSKGVGIVVLFEGPAGSGKGSRISDLMYNLDARATRVYSSPDPDPVETSTYAHRYDVTSPYPFLMPYWERLGERGCMTVFNRGWYTTGTTLSAYQVYQSLHKIDITNNDVLDLYKDAVTPYIKSIADFEQQLTADGYIIVKFYVNISSKAQIARFAKLQKDVRTSWRVTPEKVMEAAEYEQRKFVTDQILEATDFDYAPWIMLDGECVRRTNLTIAQTLVTKLAEGIAKADLAESAGAPCASPAKAPKESAFKIDPKHPTLERIDYSLALSEEEYRKELKKLQKRFAELQTLAYLRRIPIIMMYEGWDAAGKGGNIKRIAQALDARAYTIFPSPAPTRTELAHPFLWRYWTRLPKAGHVGIYDRSWYGRVLVERIEGFAKPQEWQRAYDEINQFERDLTNWGAILLKFWVEIDQDEQLKRFNLRAQNPEKSWKLTDEDWRNREKYPQYYEAVQDMFRLTSTSNAPWIILESNNKPYARIKALRTVVKALEDRLESR